MNRLATVRAVCPQCELHQGHTGIKLQRRDEDHVREWSKARRSWEASGSREKALLEQQLKDAQLELEQRPVQIVYENLDAEIVEKAQSLRDDARRSRDWAMQALSRIALLHREDRQGKCSCGGIYAKCKTAQIIADEHPILDQWEEAQKERIRKGQNHRLPENHPAVLDRRWMASG